MSWILYMCIQVTALGCNAAERHEFISERHCLAAMRNIEPKYRRFSVCKPRKEQHA